MKRAGRHCYFRSLMLILIEHEEATVHGVLLPAYLPQALLEIEQTLSDHRLNSKYQGQVQ